MKNGYPTKLNWRVMGAVFAVVVLGVAMVLAFSIALWNTYAIRPADVMEELRERLETNPSQVMAEVKQLQTDINAISQSLAELHEKIEGTDR